MRRVLPAGLHGQRQEGTDLVVNVLDEAPVVVGAHAREVRQHMVVPLVRRGQRRNGRLHGVLYEFGKGHKQGPLK